MNKEEDKEIFKETRQGVIFKKTDRILRTPPPLNLASSSLSSSTPGTVRRTLHRVADSLLEKIKRDLSVEAELKEEDRNSDTTSGSTEYLSNEEESDKENKTIKNGSIIINRIVIEENRIDNIVIDNFEINNAEGNNLVENIVENNENNLGNNIINNLVIENIELGLEMANFDYRDFSQKIPEYEGEEEMKKVFLLRCDRYHDSLDAAGQAAFYQNLVYKLKGNPFNIYETKNNWAELKLALTNDGSKLMSIHSLTVKMNTLRQYNKTVDEYAKSISQVLEDMRLVIWNTYPDAGVRNSFTTEHQNAATRIFKEGLREPLRSRVFARGEGKDFLGTVQVAREEEPFVNMNNKSENGNLNRNYNDRSSNNRNNFSNSNFSNNNNYNRSNYQMNNNQYNNTRTFGNNHQSGENRQIKTEYRKNDNNRNEDYRKPRNNGTELKCYRCGRNNHIAKDCIANYHFETKTPLKREVNFAQDGNIIDSNVGNRDNGYNKRRINTIAMNMNNDDRKYDTKNLIRDRQESHAVATQSFLSQ